jgi:hypothetical protein
MRDIFENFDTEQLRLNLQNLRLFYDGEKQMLETKFIAESTKLEQEYQAKLNELQLLCKGEESNERFN